MSCLGLLVRTEATLRAAQSRTLTRKRIITSINCGASRRGTRLVRFEGQVQTRYAKAVKPQRAGSKPHILDAHAYMRSCTYVNSIASDTVPAHARTPGKALKLNKRRERHTSLARLGFSQQVKQHIIPSPPHRTRHLMIADQHWPVHWKHPTASGPRMAYVV